MDPTVVVQSDSDSDDAFHDAREDLENLDLADVRVPPTHGIVHSVDISLPNADDHNTCDSAEQCRSIDAKNDNELNERCDSGLSNKSDQPTQPTASEPAEPSLLTQTNDRENSQEDLPKQSATSESNKPPLSTRLNVSESTESDPSMQSTASECNDPDVPHDFVKDALEDSDNESDDVGKAEQQRDEYFVDMERLKQEDTDLNEEQKQEARDRSIEIKTTANTVFKTGDYTAALTSYTAALNICPLCYKKERAILYSNRAAAFLRLEKRERVIEECTLALDLHPHYTKALQRRAESYEQADKLDEALADYTRLVEIEPSMHHARFACSRLQEQINERNEKMKAEMMGKLKDLGNMVLRPFGMSTDNFQFTPNPDGSGGYSLNMVSDPSKN